MAEEQATGEGRATADIYDDKAHVRGKLDLTEAEWAAIHPVFAEQRPPLDGLTSVSIRDIAGGTAPNRVADALSTARAAIGDQQTWFDQQAERYAALFVRPTYDVS